MIMIPADPSDRALAIDWLLEDMAHGRRSAGDAQEMLAQLRAAGDVARLEGLSRALARFRRA